MPITLAELYGEPKPLDVELIAGAGPLHITYYPAYMTPEIEAKLELLGREGSSAPVRDITSIASSIVASWDLVSEGKPLPCTPESWAKIPAQLTELILRAIFEDHAPKGT